MANGCCAARMPAPSWRLQEWPRVAGAGTTVETRVVDRSFVEDGVRWIIDYKTADLGAEADAARLAAHAERYRPQLEAYAGCLPARACPLRLAVFYAAHGILSALE
jgi:ATP-dependent helicase/nuclease subunit A